MPTPFARLSAFWTATFLASFCAARGKEFSPPQPPPPNTFTQVILRKMLCANNSKATKTHYFSQLMHKWAFKIQLKNKFLFCSPPPPPSWTLCLSNTRRNERDEPLHYTTGPSHEVSTSTFKNEWSSLNDLYIVLISLTFEARKVQGHWQSQWQKQLLWKHFDLLKSPAHLNTWRSRYA